MVVAPAWAQRAGKTRPLSLEAAMDRGDAVFTFYAGTPHHTFNIMTTTNIQYLNDQELEQVAGGFRVTPAARSGASQPSAALAT